MKYNIFKFDNWLQFGRPDPEGFRNHIWTLLESEIPYSIKDIHTIAKNYHVSGIEFINLALKKNEQKRNKV